MQWNGNAASTRALFAWANSHASCGLYETDSNVRFRACDDESVMVNTLFGWARLNPGDFVVKGANGEFYPCKADAFNSIYVEVDNGH